MAALRAAVERTPSEPGGMLALGRALRERALRRGGLGGHLEAERIASTALGISPRMAEALVLRGQARLSLHRAAEARADAAAAVRLSPGDLEAALLLADANAEAGRLAAARAMLEQIAPARPHAYVLGRLAAALMRYGDLDEADRVYRRAEQAASPAEPAQRAWVRVQRAILARERGRFSESLGHLREALAIDPGHHPADELLPEVARLAGDMEAARAACAGVAAAGADAAAAADPERLSACALVRAAGGDAEGARAPVDRAAVLYQELLAAFPEAAGRDAARFLLRHGRDAARAAELAAAAARARPTAESFRVLAEAELAARRVPAARAAIERAIATGERSARLSLAAARVAEAAGDAAAARARREQALALNPQVDRLGP